MRRRPSFIRRLLVGCVILLSATTLGHARRVPSPGAGAFAAVGAQAERGYFSQQPFERVDMVNGNLMLSFTDLVLPGNAGMDLRITRTYNHQGSGNRWTFAFGGVPLRIVDPIPIPDQLWRPSLLAADGSTQPLHEGVISGYLVTTDFAKYDATNRKLYLPNGWTASYSSDLYARLIEVHDAYGNSITPSWHEYVSGSGVWRIASVEQNVSDTGGTRTRTVGFQYQDANNPGLPTSIGYGSRVWTYQYSGPGRLASAAPEGGPAWAFAYSLAGNDGSITVTTPSGGTVEYEFDEQTLGPDNQKSVVRETTTGGRAVQSGTWSFLYGISGNSATSSVGYPLGRTVAFQHEYRPGPNGFDWTLETRTLSNGQSVVATMTRSYTTTPFQSGVFGALNAVDQQVITQDGVSFTTNSDYSSSDFADYRNANQITESASNHSATRVTTRSFDHTFTDYVVARVTSTTVAIGGDSLTSTATYNQTTGFLESQTASGLTTTFSPDGFGNVGTVTDPHGHQTSSSYLWGVPASVATPEYTITRSINQYGLADSETRNGDVTVFEYDDIGRPKKVIPAAGAEIVTNYASDGSSTTVTQDSSWTVTHVDGFGRSTGSENVLGIKTSATIDVEGFRTFQSAPFTGSAGTGNYFTYDALGRLKQITHTDLSQVTYTYGETDVSITDENNHTTTQHWQAFGSPGGSRLTGLHDAAGQLWTYAYDAAGNLRQVTAPTGPNRTWTYTNNLLTSESHPESGTTTYSYTGGLLTGRTDARNQSFGYVYDGNHRLTQVVAPDSAETTTFEYDAADNQTRMVVGGLESLFTYDDANRLSAREDRINGTSFTTSYEYDNRDNLIKVTYPSGRIVQYLPDSGNRITKVYSGATTYADNLAYHATGAMTAASFGNGRSESLTLNSRFRPEHLVSGPLDVTYTYEANGNVSVIDDARAGFDSSYGYDALDRLTNVSGFGATSFAYDAQGNRLYKDAGGYSVFYAYNGATNRLTTATSPLSSEAGTFTYDNAGNMQTDGTGSYTYSARNMMRTATVANTTTTYEYDAAGLRAIKSAPGSVRYYVRGLGSQVLAEYDATTGTPVLAKEYIYLGSRLLASFNETVPTPPVSTQLTAPAAGAISPADAPILLSATANATGGASISSVQFYANGLYLGADSSAPYEFVWAPTVAGPFKVTSRAIASSGKVANSVPASVTITPIGRVMGVSVSPVSPLAGQSATVSVTGNAYACGAVEINYGDGTIVTYANAPPFGIAHTWATAGTQTVTASGQGNCLGSVSTSVSVVNNSPPTVSLTAPTSGSVQATRRPMTLTAAASDPHGVSQVQFRSNGSWIGTAWSAPWTVTWTPTTDGTHNLTAYAIDGYGIGGESSVVPITVTPVTRIVVTPANPSAGSAALVTVEGSADCAVNVDFGDGNVQTFISESGLPITNPHTWSTAGAKVLTAVGLGGGCQGTATTSATVLAPPIVSLTSPTAGAIFNPPATISLAATATAAQGSIARIDFYANGTQVGSDTSSPFAATWSNVAEGSYTITAVATDTYGASASSGSVSVIVGNPPPSTVLAVTVTPNPATAYTSATVTVSGTNPCTMLWMDFGDGDWWIAPIDPGLPFVTTHAWAPGTYTVLAKGFVTCGGEVTTVVAVNATTPAPTSTSSHATSVGPSEEPGDPVMEGSAAEPFIAPTMEGTAPAVPVAVTLDIAPGASGTVTSGPSGFNCSGSDTTCAANFESGIAVTLTATPASGKVFLGWAGACTGTASTCQISAASGQLVTAAFGNASTATISYYHTDLLGSVRAITDAAGNETAPRLDYQPFGESTASLQGDSRKFLGQDRDAETAFDQLGARYYRNVWGRFTSVDPIFSTAPTNPQRWNRYAYGLNNPLRYADPSGLDAEGHDFSTEDGPGHCSAICQEFSSWADEYVYLNENIAPLLALQKRWAAEAAERQKAEEERAYREVRNQIAKAGLLPLIAEMEWTGHRFEGKFADVAEVRALLSADKRFKGPGWAWRMHAELRASTEDNLLDFRSKNGSLGTGSMQVVYSKETRRFHIDVDRFSAYGLGSLLGHALLEVLPNFFIR